MLAVPYPSSAVAPASIESTRPSIDVSTARLNTLLNGFEVVVKMIKRVLLEDRYASRMAYINATTAHAKLVKAISDIAFSPAEIEMIEQGELANAEVGGNA